MVSSSLSSGHGLDEKQPPSKSPKRTRAVERGANDKRGILDVRANQVPSPAGALDGGRAHAALHSTTRSAPGGPVFHREPPGARREHPFAHRPSRPSFR